MLTPGQAAFRWRKSSHSNGNGSNCVELAQGVNATGVRDSKNPDGPVLVFTQMSAFLDEVKANRFHRS